jgi:hypothetical protein
MNGSVLDEESAPFQPCVKVLADCGLLRIDPNDQKSSGAQEVDKPIERRLDGPERTPAPIDQRDLVLSGGPAAVRCRRDVNEAVPIELGRKLDTLRARYNNALLLGAICKGNHRLEDAITCGYKGERVMTGHHFEYNAALSRAE